MNVINTLSDLIKINTTNPPGNEKEITHYIRNQFRGHDDMIELDHGDNRASLLVTIRGESDEKVAIVGHIDTVPVSDPGVWKYPPFDAHIENGRMYGRGTSDMKSGVACMIALGDYFIQNKIKPNRTIQLIFTADEEADGIGILDVFDKGFLDDTDFILVPENTSNDVVLKEKGALWISVELFGKSAHGARPDLGINSIEIVYELTRELQSFVENSCNDELLGNSTVSLNTISGGEKVNMIADYCKAEIDIRANPDLDNKDILNYLEKLIRKFEHKYQGLNVKYHVLTDRPSLEMSSQNPFVREFIDVLDTMNLAYAHAGITYFTDLSLTIPELNSPFLIFGPGSIDKGHQVDESVELTALENASKAYIEFFRQRNM